MVMKVTNVTSLTRSGLSDFVIQRVSAVVMAVYTLCVFGFFVANPGMTHDQLVGYFASVPMVLFSTLTVLATAAHAWIGMWTVALLFVYVAWALQLFWSL